MEEPVINYKVSLSILQNQNQRDSCHENRFVVRIRLSHNCSDPSLNHQRVMPIKRNYGN